VLGALSGFGEYTRYAAADLYDDEKFKSRAISFVVSSGIVAAFIGPSLASWSNDLISVQFVGPYLVCVGLCSFSFVLYAFLNVKAPIAEGDEQTEAERIPLKRILLAPIFIAGTAAGIVAYLTMAVLMDAAPMSMLDHGYHYAHTTQVIQWHLLAMFAPAYLTARAIEKYGAVVVIYFGIAINVVGLGFGLTDTTLVNYWVALLLVGLGWNFMFVAGTTLLASIPAAERAGAEATSNFLMSSSFALATPISAVIMVHFGWRAVCTFAVALLLIAFCTTLSYSVFQRRVTIAALSTAD
jgi:hypothetical protein